jgi:DNA-directed RNA polymerase sigma subunit (sigma70/sigma32)
LALRRETILDDVDERRDNGYMTLWPAEDGWPYPDSLGDFVDVAGEADDDLVSMRADTHLFDSLDSLEREVISARFGLRGHQMRTAAELHSDLGLPDADIEGAFGSGLAKLRTHLST